MPQMSQQCNVPNLSRLVSRNGLSECWSLLDVHSQRWCSVKKVFLEISLNSHENSCDRVSFLIKLQAYNFIKKETLAQVFSCEFSKISKNTFFTEHLLETGSGGISQRRLLSAETKGAE